MNTSPSLEMREGYAVFRVSGSVVLDEAVQTISAALASAREQQVRKLLLDITQVVVETPGLGARYFIVREWARAAQGMIRVAILLKPELLDAERFGMTVAANAGLTAEVFLTESEALTWLMGERP